MMTVGRAGETEITRWPGYSYRYGDDDNWIGGWWMILGFDEMGRIKFVAFHLSDGVPESWGADGRS